MKNIDKKITSTIEVLDHIEKVEAPHFFAHKVLQKIATEKESQKKYFSWFSPTLQLAAIGLVLVVNAIVLTYSFNSSNTSNTDAITTFAEEYSLQDSSDTLLN
ncbi:hypothetical protein N9V96_00515 [Polaribacter sp.]|nr:hypothetical protein [Polaribacter sp.]